MPNKFKKGDIVKCVHIINDSYTILGLIGIIAEGEPHWSSSHFVTKGFRYRVLYNKKGTTYRYSWWTNEEALELYSEEYPDICEWE